MHTGILQLSVFIRSRFCLLSLSEDEVSPAPSTQAQTIYLVVLLTCCPPPNPSTTHTHTSKDSDTNKMVIFSTPKSPRVACSSRECVYVLDFCNPYALWAGPRFARFLTCCFTQIPKSKIAVLRFRFPPFS